MGDNYCNNCGKQGHLYHQCKMPITSIGIVAYRIHNQELQYLMICRKDTLGFIDFMRGKYSVNNKDYIMNMLKQMTNSEKLKLKTCTFNEIWCEVWGIDVNSTQYKNEENLSRDKFNTLTAGFDHQNGSYSLKSMVDESMQYMCWETNEWGFPKGRRNYMEKDYDCAVREFCEETGYNKKSIHNIKNLFPFEEVFTGSNYKSYKHKYYLAYMNVSDTSDISHYEPTEVSDMKWKTYDECIQSIRPYNLEKKRILTCIHNTLLSFPIIHL